MHTPRVHAAEAALPELKHIGRCKKDLFCQSNIRASHSTSTGISCLHTENVPRGTKPAQPRRSAAELRLSSPASDAPEAELMVSSHRPCPILLARTRIGEGARTR
jgi:hypothetical protein